MKFNLLTDNKSNKKISKNNYNNKYLSAILHLAPSTLSGYNTCKAACSGCKASCLNLSGHGFMSTVQKARIRKTKLLFEQQQLFMEQLIKDLTKLEKKATKESKKAVCRLNGTSDIPWETIEYKEHNIFNHFPNIQFYDYTKIPIRMLTCSNIPNYHLTFSRSSANEKQTMDILKTGFNVAIVFDQLPEAYKGFSVIDGTTHDLRFLDPKGSIVGLLPLAKAKKDNTGFVVKSV